ncbi:AAA family ATPase [Candidatus Uabimicrobium sp. HlEnr_7]|uniref:AAA family ATPase n=1 Tax=Candidatus Uabimicrobium helgolandensis TaxID=3095367 RepID=UPI003557D67B
MENEKIDFPYLENLKNSNVKDVQLQQSLFKIPKKRDYAGKTYPYLLTDKNLEAAADMAILLNQPLLLTGEAGVGKTQFAYYLANKLGWEVFDFDTTSASTAEEVFYTYDTLGRFSAVNLDQLKPEQAKAANYIEYHALGKAILYSRAKDDKIKEFLSNKIELPDQPKRVVVLIDEIDKAPRDFPNDLLNRLEKLSFRIPFISDKEICVDEEYRPIVIFTSNEEKPLPNPFLRRCIYCNIEFPSKKSLKKIVDLRLEEIKPLSSKDKFIDDALELFFILRENELSKKPSIAELLGWLITLYHGLKLKQQDEQIDLKTKKDELLSSLQALIKNKDDFQTANAVVEKWVE